MSKAKAQEEKRNLTKKEKKRIFDLIRHEKGDRKPRTAQDSIPFERMFKDGLCKLSGNRYSKCIAFEDINYQLAQPDDKTATFEALCDMYNYFDASVGVQLSLISRYANKEDFQKSIYISPQGDDFDGIRTEYTDMLQTQLERGNNGLIKTKFLTFTVEADNLKMARARLNRIEIDTLNHFKVLGAAAHTLDGKQRLEVLHGIFHPDGERFHFRWDDLPKSGLSVKDYIAPSSFRFGEGRMFRMGGKYGAASFLQIVAPELNDRMLADFMEAENGIIVNLHIRSIEHNEAIKTIKRKITDLDRMKIEEQKKAVRSGYDMDIIPSDLATYGGEAKNLLRDLQSRNERMFLLTFLVVNMADTKQKLENEVFAAAGVAQKYNCTLTRLDYQQEQGLMSSIPLGENLIKITRGLTTSSTAIFVPFTVQELFQQGEALYYGLNALSNNMILCDRKQLKNPNGLILGTPGCFAGETRLCLADGTTASFAELVSADVTETLVRAYDERSGEYVTAMAKEIRIERYADELHHIAMQDGTGIYCTAEHLIMDAQGAYIPAKEITEGQQLSGGHTVNHVTVLNFSEKIPVYDLTVPEYFNFVLYNGLVVHNSGKSFSAKREMTNAFLVTQDDIIICDPEAEYFPLVNRLKGQVIRLSPTGRGADGKPQYLNPMDINLNYSEDDNPLALKSDFILSLCELVVGGKEGLQPVEKTIIDRAVINVYREYLADPQPEKMPILGDLYEEIKKQPEAEAQRIASALELYVHGSLNVFNHRTNVDIHNRLVCFDIKELGKQLKKLGMLIVQDQVWNRVTINRSAGKSTRYYIDEFHLLLKEEQTAAYSVEIWKRFRKWGGIPTGITQNVKDLLSSREVENIFENSDFVYMLNQAAGDREILAKQLNISPQQMSYVTHSDAGEGLIFFGNVVLPFVDRFPKDTELYRVMTTKPEEVSE